MEGKELLTRPAVTNREDQVGPGVRVSRSLRSVTEFTLGGETCIAAPISETDSDQHESVDSDARECSGTLAGVLLIDQVSYVVLVVDKPSPQPATASVDDGEQLSQILTRRELQIATLVAEGKVNKQIAYQLRISEWTVSTHLRRIFAKLGVHSRAAMAAYVASHLCES